MIISDHMFGSLDPEISRFATHLVSRGAGPAEALSLNEIRRRAIELRLPLNSGGPKMFDTKDHRLQLESVQLLLRVYRPRATARDVLFYFHGGGSSLLNLDCFDRVMREYADATKCCVVGIEFPQAPEHPYPLAINAICFLLDRWKIIGRDLGFNHERFAFAGDSAGANLALAVSLRRLEERKSIPSAMILHYGVYDCDLSRSSYFSFGGGTLPLFN